MEKKSESEKGLNQVLTFGALFLVVFALVIGFVIGQVVPQIAPSENKAQSARIESLKSENTVLRKALSEKLISHCDTATVDQKLAQQKLDDYTYKMYEIKEAQTFKAYDWQEAEGLKIYQKNEDAGLKAYEIYSKVEAAALIELEKNDPKNFYDYAVICFKYDQHNWNYDVSIKISEKKEALEKIPSISKTVAIIRNAWNVKSSEDKKLQAVYNQKQNDLKSAYQNKLKVIEENYNKKIAAKKAELGL